MKKGFWVIAVKSTSDPAAVKAYGELAGPAVQSAGGRFLTRPGSRLEVHEAGALSPAVIVEFDSYDIACAAHASEGYQEALRVLGSGAERDFRIVEGV